MGPSFSGMRDCGAEPFRFIREWSREYYIRVFDRRFTVVFPSPRKRDGRGPKGEFLRSGESSLADAGQIRVNGAGYG
jgi:hypothetical protein